MAVPQQLFAFQSSSHRILDSWRARPAIGRSNAPAIKLQMSASAIWRPHELSQYNRDTCLQACGQMRLTSSVQTWEVG